MTRFLTFLGDSNSFTPMPRMFQYHLHDIHNSHFQRFVSDPEVRKARHSAIAEYFIGRWAGQKIPYVGKDGTR